jgi:hypothetical protein
VRITLVLFAACTGTDTGNPPVIDFGNSGCHDQGYKLSKSDQPAYQPDSHFRGLNCLTWERTDRGNLRISATNIDAACGSSGGWRPKIVRRDDGGLDLVVQDDQCETAGCDSGCLFDVSVTIPFDSTIEDSLVRAYKHGCDDVAAQGFAEFEGHLALVSQASGAVCRYATYNKVEIANSGGQERGRCNNDMSCEPSNTCVNLGSHLLCLRACQTDSDCDTLSRCDGAVCQLSATGLTSGSASGAR